MNMEALGDPTWRMEVGNGLLSTSTLIWKRGYSPSRPATGSDLRDGWQWNLFDLLIVGFSVADEVGPAIGMPLPCLTGLFWGPCLYTYCWHRQALHCGREFDRLLI